MKITFALGKFLLIILVLGLVSIQAQSTQQPVLFNFEPNSKPASFTEKDREFALKYLNETKDEFLKAVSGLTEEQFNFKPDPKKWSVAEVAEHIIVVETRLLPTITEKILKNNAPEGKDFYRVVDRGIIMAMTNRTTKLQAPEAIQPKGRWRSKAEIINAFEKARGATISYLEKTTADLRDHFAANPGLGVLDAYQWFIFLSAHGDRHIAQINEVLSSPNFPKK